MVRDMIKGLNSLEAEQTRLKRNNARERVVYAIRHIIRVLDAEYPRIALPPEMKKPRRVLCNLDRERKLKKQGFEEWVGVSGADIIKLTMAGVPVRRLRVPRNGDLPLGPANLKVCIWAPTWARQLMDLPGSRLAEAAKSPNARKVFLAEAALRKSHSP
jgi:hypothetical protein